MPRKYLETSIKINNHNEANYFRFASALSSALGLDGPFQPVPSLTHYLLASLPQKTVVTTNYDSLFEQALKNIKKAAFTINTPQGLFKK